MKSVAETLYYYPGCCLGSSARELGESLFQTARLLGYRLQELKNWNCCGASAAHSIRPMQSMLLGARNLLLAEEMGIEELFIVCPSCFVRLSETESMIRKDNEKNREVVKIFGRPYEGKVKVRFFLELVDELDLEDLKKLIKHPTVGLRTAIYYGCLLSRQEWITGFALGTREKWVEDLLSVIGVEFVHWGYGRECCGAYMAIPRQSSADRLVDKIRDNAARAEANCLLTFCPLCQMNLEMRGKETEPLPVFYLSELLCRSAGLPQWRGWLRRHLVNPKHLLN